MVKCSLHRCVSCVKLPSTDELDKELLTAEIKVFTPSISSASYDRSTFAMQPIQLPALPAEVVFGDPQEYIDRTLDSHGEDRKFLVPSCPQPPLMRHKRTARQYWEVPFSRLAPPDMLNIANTLASQGVEAAIELIGQYSKYVRDWLATQSQKEDQAPEPETRSVTSGLVSPSDPVVEDSPRRALAGAVGDVRVPLQPGALIALDLLSDPGSTPPGLSPKFDATMEDADATSDDTDSVVAWPYGPSRSTTLDNPVVGGAPDGHLGDQFVAMMEQLPGRVSAAGSRACTPVGHDIVPPYVDRHQAPELTDEKMERPRLLSMRLS